MNDGTTITPRQAEAVRKLLELDYSVWSDMGPHLTCTEADTIAELLDAFGGDGDALLIGHASEDDEGDEHESLVDADGYAVGYARREGGEVR